MVSRIVSLIVALTCLLVGVAPTLRSQVVSTEQQSRRASRLPGFVESLVDITDLLNRGRGIEAERVSRLLLAKVEEVLGPDALEVAEVLDLLGRAVRLSSNVPVAEKASLAGRSLTIREKALGPWHPDVATSLTSLAVQKTLAGDPAAAQPLLERAVAIREKALGPNHLSVASTLGSLAGVLMTLRDDAGAKVVLERVLAIRESNYGATHIETIGTLFRVALFYAEIGDETGARRYFERATTGGEQAFGPNHPLVFDILLRQAVVLSEVLGDYAASARLNDRLVVQAETLYGPADARLTVPLRNLALDRRDLGDYAAARTLAERSLSIAERAFGPAHPDVADALHTLAGALAAQGAYGEAMQAFERATHINEQVRRPPDPDLSRASWFIPDLFPVSGYGGDDAPLFERTVAIREAQGGLADPRATESLTNLAAVLASAADYTRTQPLFERALVAQEAAHGPDHPEVAAAATNLADVLTHAGEPGRARVLYTQALNIMERSLGPDHPKISTALLRLAALDARSGNDQQATLLERRALAIQERQLGPAHPDVADTLAGLSVLRERAGATAEAFDIASRADLIRREHIRLTMRSLPERQAMAYASSAGVTRDVMLSIAAAHAEDDGTSSRAWNALIQSRGIVLDEMAARRRAANATEDPDVAALRAAVTSARQRLAALVIRGIRDEPPERYRRLIDRARGDKEKAERDLALASSRFRDDQAASRLGVAELEASLERGAALVAFAKYRQHTRSSANDGVPSYLAFVLRAGTRTPAVVPLGPATAIDGLVAQWQRQIRQEALAAGRATPRGETAYRRVAAELRARVWDPLLPYLSSSTRVFIVPDGTLNLVSFSALPTTSSRYLVDTGPLIHYLSAERDLMRSPAAGSRTGGLLAIGNPAFDEEDSAPPVEGLYRGSRAGCTDFQSIRFDRLPAAVREVNAVATLWSRTQRSITSLLGAAATERAFKVQAARHRVLHVATHGFFLGDNCMPGSDAPIDGPGSARVLQDNPLLLSGLILAGANHRDTVPPDQDDGVLTAEEVATLDLSGVEWAVLSGCDTGVGEIRAGEGVFGLRRAFHVAGARTVIVSLWPVEDETTRQWMSALYENRLTRNLSTADAVREASRSMLRLRRTKGITTHPLYWAAFVAAGDWR